LETFKTFQKLTLINPWSDQTGALQVEMFIKFVTGTPAKHQLSTFTPYRSGSGRKRPDRLQLFSVRPLLVVFNYGLKACFYVAVNKQISAF